MILLGQFFGIGPWAGPWNTGSIPSTLISRIVNQWFPLQQTTTAMENGTFRWMILPDGAMISSDIPMNLPFLTVKYD